jgi:hypothetical protein
MTRPMAGQHRVFRQRLVAVCPVTCAAGDEDGFPRRFWLGSPLASNPTRITKKLVRVSVRLFCTTRAELRLRGHYLRARTGVEILNYCTMTSSSGYDTLGVLVRGTRPRLPFSDWPCSSRSASGLRPKPRTPHVIGLTNLSDIAKNDMANDVKGRRIL